MPPTGRWIPVMFVGSFIAVSRAWHAPTRRVIAAVEGSGGPVGGGHAPDRAVVPGEVGGYVLRWVAGMARSYTLCDGQG